VAVEIEIQYFVYLVRCFAGMLCPTETKQVEQQQMGGGLVAVAIEIELVTPKHSNSVQ
jgi:hypothetical protein